MPRSYIGVDLHSDNFFCCILKKDKEPLYQKYTLDAAGLESFKNSISKSDQIAVEATSNSGFFCKKIEKRVKKIVLVAPSQFSVIGKSSNKSDLGDAYKLALFLSRDMLPKARLKDQRYSDLSSLIDLRAQLVRIKSSLLRKTHTICLRKGVKIPKSRLSPKKGFKVHVYTQHWDSLTEYELNLVGAEVELLNSHISKLEKSIEEAASELRGYENIMSIKGVGPLTAATILTAIGDIDDFPSAAHLCSYFGIVPKKHQSNNMMKMGRITKAGSKMGRSALVQCAWISVKYNPHLKNFFDRLNDRGGAKKAIVACSRKLLVIIYKTLKNDWIFDDFPTFKFHVRDKSELSASN